MGKSLLNLFVERERRTALKAIVRAYVCLCVSTGGRGEEGLSGTRGWWCIVVTHVKLSEMCQKMGDLARCGASLWKD